MSIFSRDKTRYDIVDLGSGRVLETVTGPRAARRAQGRWHNNRVWKNGPLTKIRPHRSAADQSVEDALAKNIPAPLRQAYREAFTDIIRHGIPVDEFALSRINR